MLISKNANTNTKDWIFRCIKIEIKILNLIMELLMELDKNNTYKSSPYLHEKFFYLKRDGKNEFGLGLVHEAVWAGSTKE